MMEDGLLSLKWNNHKTTFFEILRELREKANYTDATIAVDGKFYPVHKLVMSTCSEYFNEIFTKTPCKSPVIVLKDVRHQDIEALLDYMYLGEVNVNQNDLASLLKTAECLRIKGLAVPDEDPAKSRKTHPPPEDRVHDSPPPKRRRNDDTTSNARPSSPSKAPPPSAPTVASHPASSASLDSSTLDLGLDAPPLVKVEMQEPDDADDYRKDNSYEVGSVNEGDMGSDYGQEVSKAEHDPDSYGSGSFAGPSIQPGGDLPWDEGDSSSFPQEGFSGDVPGPNQPQGGLGGCGVAAADARHAWTGGGNAPSSFGIKLTSGGPNVDKHQLLLAVQAVAGGHMTGRQAARAFNVPRTTLRRWVTYDRRLHPCPYCPYRATEKSHLKKHVACRHRDLPNPLSSAMQLQADPKIDSPPELSEDLPDQQTQNNEAILSAALP